MTYRDGLGPRWQRTRDEIDVTLARLKRLPGWVLAHAPQRLRQGLTVAPALASAAPPATLEALEQTEGALAALRAALDEAEALAARGERVGVIPGRVLGRRPPPPPDEDVSDDFDERAAQLSRMLAAYGSPLQWVEHERVSSRFERGGVAYSLTYDYQRFRVATKVPSGAPEFRVVPQTGFDDLLQALRLRKRRTVGVEEFDAMFRVVGDERGVGLLDPPVRGALFLLARVDVPSLEVGGGEAAVSWSAPPSLPPIERAMRALVALRAALGAR